MLRCLKPLAEWDPAQGEAILKRLWKEFAKEAHTTVPVLKRAYSRIVFDGYYGPVDDREWYRSDGHSMTMRRALALLRKALEHNPYVSFYHPDVGQMCDGVQHCSHPDHEDADEPGPMFHEEEVVVDPHDIKREMFHGLIEIYGHLDI